MFSRLLILLILTLPHLAFAGIEGTRSPLGYDKERSGRIILDILRSGFSCIGHRLLLESSDLQMISEDNGVQVALEDSEDCQRNLKLIMELVRDRTSIEVKYKARKRTETYHLNYSEGCNETTCHIDVDEREITDVEIQFLGYSMTGGSSRSIGQRTVTWPRYSCPPWSPDCDL